MLKELFLASTIVALCVIIHTIGLVILVEWLLAWRSAIERHFGVMRQALLLAVVFAFIILLHVGETAIWAAFYYLRSLFQDYETSLYFSLSSYTTIGYGDVLLPQRWRLLGTVEGVSGVLLCGLSTAFIFAIVNVMFQSRVAQRPAGSGN